MTSKILKIELLFITLLTALSFISFYYQDVLPDNMYAISSSESSIGYFSYALSSLVAAVGYYTGPCMIFTMIFSVFSYSFLYSKRDLYLDTLGCFSLAFGTIFLSFGLAPSLLGEGLSFVISTYLNVWMSFIVGLIFFTGYFYINFRSNFKLRVKKIISSLAEK